MARGRKKEKKELTPEERLQNALVPKEEWPYELPEGWKWVALDGVCDFERGITFPASVKESNKREGNIACLRTANVQEEIDLSDLIYVDTAYVKNKKEKIVRNGDIIMSSANSRELVGKVSYISSDIREPMTFGGFVLAIRSFGALSRFVFYYLRMLFLLGRFRGQSTQTTNIANISTKKLAKVKMALPPQNVQISIVSFLDQEFRRLDEAKDQIQSVLDSSAERKQSILHKAFTGELTEKWRKENGHSLDEWKIIKLQDYCEKITCGKTPKNDIAAEGDIPYLKVYNIVNNSIDFHSKPQFIPREVHEGKLNSSRLKPHDVIMNIVGPPLRKIAIVPEDYPEWNMNQAIVRFRPKNGLHYKYLYYALINPETLDAVIQQTKGVVGQANISVTQSRNLTIPLPSLQEQMEIVKCIEQLLNQEANVIEVIEKSIEEINEMKKAILSKAFRGELLV